MPDQVGRNLAAVWLAGRAATPPRYRTLTHAARPAAQKRFPNVGQVCNLPGNLGKLQTCPTFSNRLLAVSSERAAPPHCPHVRSRRWSYRLVTAAWASSRLACAWPMPVASPGEAVR